MNKNIKIAFGFFLLVILLLTYLEASEPEPVNWNPSYLETDKIALGTYVFFESWKKNTSAEIEKTDRPPFEFLNEEPTGTYFFLNDHIVFDDSELSRLLLWVEQGNSLFVSAGYISKNLLDTLNISAVTFSGPDNFISRPRLNFVNPRLKHPEGFKYPYDVEALYFNEIDTLNQKVLGISVFGKDPSKEKVNFVKAEFGEGKIFLHTNPQALANFFLLTNDNYKYAEGILAYIDPSEKIYWDRHYKSGKIFYSSPLYVLLENKPLKWAYYFILAGSFLFLIFEGKRKQRAIPVVNPLKNQTYEYAGTIADLYLEQKDYRALAAKKIDHFYEYLRSRYRIDTSRPEKEFLQELAEKSGKSETEVKAFFDKIREITKKNKITKDELQDLNKDLNSFKYQPNG